MATTRLPVWVANARWIKCQPSLERPTVSRLRCGRINMRMGQEKGHRYGYALEGQEDQDLSCIRFKPSRPSFLAPANPRPLQSKLYTERRRGRLEVLLNQRNQNNRGNSKRSYRKRLDAGLLQFHPRAICLVRSGTFKDTLTVMRPMIEGDESPKKKLNGLEKFAG